jgi:transposase
MKVKRRKERRLRPRRVELKLDDLKAIVERAKPSLSAEDHDTLSAAVDTLAFLTQELESKGMTIARLRQMIFGASTEKTAQVEARVAPDAEAQREAGQGEAADAEGEQGRSEDKPSRPGHGRRAAAEYKGANKVEIPHPVLALGGPCPECPKGRVYPLEQPKVLVRVQGVAPLSATVYEMARLRCNACGTVFAAPTPEGIGEKKYDETVAALIALLRYGCGLPFNRIERMQEDLGIPMPAGTQWELVEQAVEPMVPACDELVRQAAQGQVLHNDDTPMKILDLMKETAGKQPEDSDEPEGHRKRTEGSSDPGHTQAEDPDRKGVFTSGVLAVNGGHQIALFFTGHKHAGENLAEVLRQRPPGLDPPIQMCDALSRNTTGVFGTIVANCLAHGRRRYVDVAANFPDECLFVLETLGDVYANDDLARQGGLSAQERLLLHKEKSGPLMNDLKHWMAQQFEERLVEPASGLGEAISYMTDHWTELTRFLEAPGAPLDNNVCERALKKAILHRKNSLFYKTKNGARVGDLLMSLIHTAELARAEVFGYLVALQRHPDEVAANPADWMPWNYQQALARLVPAPSSAP